MKVRKLTKLFIAIITIALMLSNTSYLYAIGETTNATETGTIKLGATLWRENTEKKKEDELANIAYISNISESGNLSELRVWKLVEQTGDVSTIDVSKAIYCLKAGIGFVDDLNEDTYTSSGVQYNKSYDMYEKETIKTALGWDDATYNKVLWIIDNMYVKGVSTTTDKENLLKAVTHTEDSITKNLYDWTNATTSNIDDLTENDIEVIQQMALWYFTNADETKYHNDSMKENFLPLSLAFRESLSEEASEFKTISNWYFDSSDEYLSSLAQARQDYAAELFKYFINNADENYIAQDTENIKATFWTYEGEETETNPRQPVVIIEKKEEKYFDLALRKFITNVSDGEYKNTYYRIPEITEEQIQKLANGEIKTVEKTHSKTPVEVNTGNVVTYTIRIYNEGDISGYANEVTDYLPSGLKFLPDSTINKTYGWKCYDGKTVTTNYLKDKLIEAFNGTEIDYVDLQIECEVIEENSSAQKKLKNVAEITKAKDENGNDMNLEGDDRDSTPNNLSDTQKQNYNPGESEKGWGYEDDDDYEDLVLPGKQVDLALRKFITAIGDSELKDEEGKYLREPEVLTSTIAETKTATYNHPKTPLTVKVGDIVTYTIRVYNEGDIDGYVSEITDHLPQWLEFVTDSEEYPEETDFNTNYLWTVSADGRTIKTTITSKDLTDTYDTLTGEIRGTTLLEKWDGTENVLDYIDVKVKCKVIDTVGEDILTQGTKITNIADITGMTDSEGNILNTDRDSQVDNVGLPADADLSEYKQAEINAGREYIEGQQDDDDFEKVIVQSFDLALRKFITAVDEMPVNNRYPSPIWDSTLNRIVYNHPKTPVEVAYEDVVTYTIRVYNEGTVDGYAQEVTDDLPEYLTYLPEHEINKQYGWVLRDSEGNEVDDVEDAVCITTDYLSKENGEELTVENEDGITTTTNSNLLKAFDKSVEITDNNPDYREIKVAMRVDLQITGENLEDSKRILINEAQISEDVDKDGLPVQDIDSDPNRDDKYNYDGDNEDDIDYEPVKVNYFDLALKKWVTQSIVTENGKTTVTESGHTGDENPEPAMKVEIKSKNINKVNVKFKFSIKVTNQGEIAGYATELTDHIPEGLEFVQEDNPDWYVKEGNLVATKALENTLLQPGESATVEIVLQWINGNDNFGLKTNYAEISEDYNASNTPDIDSVPGNLEGDPKEDDEDEAPVVLSIKTGEAPMYLALTSSIIGMFTGGVLMIKKYVI